MKKVPTDHEINIEDESKEVDIKINYRCFIGEKLALYPMDVYSSIHKGFSLQDAIKHSKERHLEDYVRVEVVDVYVDEIDNSKQ